MLKATKRSGRWYSRKKFRERAAQVHERDGITCQICHQFMVYVDLEQPGKSYLRRHTHHWIAERWVRRFCKGADPHILENLADVHPGCHAKATAAEKMLYAGNWVGFTDAMRRIGIPSKILSDALAALTESCCTSTHKKT